MFQDVLLVGGGAIALEAHLPRLRGLPGNRRVALFELNPERRAEIRERFRDDAALELPDALPEDPFDLAVLATPPRFHLQDVERLAPRCPRFVIEKPLAHTLADAEAIARLLEGRHLAVHMPRAELGAFALVADLYRRRRFGALVSMQVHDGRVFDWPAVSPALFSKELSGGGVLMDLGPHVLERLLALFATLEVRGCRVDGDRGAVEANAVLDLLGDAEVPVTVAMSRNRRLSGTATLTFQEAECRVDLMGPQVRLTPATGLPLEFRATEDAGDVGFGTLVSRFYQRRVVEGRTDPSRSVQVMRLLDEAYRLAQPFRGGF